MIWRIPFAVFLLALAQPRPFAAAFTEDFATPPPANGWRVFGATNLFQWNETNESLWVTWDSSQRNSFFALPLGTILTRDDDFSLSFDLKLEDYAIGTTPGKLSTFEIALGFLNWEQAIQTNFYRGAGINATYGPKNLVEFNFFPAFDFFLPTIGQAIVSTNNAWLYNDSNLLDLTPDETFRVTMSYHGGLHTLTTIVTNQGTPYGQTQTIAVPANFDFRLTTFSISSYSDAIQPPPAGSILAHGMVDNIHIVTPPPPVKDLTGSFAGATWHMQFMSRSNWLYELERTTNHSIWQSVAGPLTGDDHNLILTDDDPPTGYAFYRIRANRP